MATDAESESVENPAVVDFAEVEVGEPLELREVSETKRRGDTTRLWIAVILGVTFLLTVSWALYVATFKGTAWVNAKEALQILLPVESSLLGSAVVFYFTGKQN